MTGSHAPRRRPGPRRPKWCGVLLAGRRRTSWYGTVRDHRVGGLTGVTRADQRRPQIGECSERLADRGRLVQCLLDLPSDLLGESTGGSQASRAARRRSH